MDGYGCDGGERSDTLNVKKGNLEQKRKGAGEKQSSDSSKDRFNPDTRERHKQERQREERYQI